MGKVIYYKDVYNSLKDLQLNGTKLRIKQMGIFFLLAEWKHHEFQMEEKKYKKLGEL